MAREMLDVGTLLRACWACKEPSWGWGLCSWGLVQLGLLIVRAGLRAALVGLAAWCSSQFVSLGQAWPVGLSWVVRWVLSWWAWAQKWAPKTNKNGPKRALSPIRIIKMIK